VEKVARSVRLTPGARTLIRTLKRMGMRTAIVSGGFSHVTDFLAAELGVDHAAANVLEVADGQLTGRLVGEVVDRAGKARILKEIAEKEGIPSSRWWRWATAPTTSTCWLLPGSASPSMPGLRFGS